MKNNRKQVRVRFAPSPTGEVHIGSARTALFNYLFARHNDGKMVLRVEDTDQKRFVTGSVERLLESMKWLGIEFDESPEKGGKFGPYIQSERLGIYQEYTQKLIEEGHAYYCFCSEDRLKIMREKQIKKGQAPMYDKTCQHLSGEEIKKKIDSCTPYVIRLKVPESGKTVFDDLIRGHIEIDNYTIDDQILIKSDGMPTYHLANAVDDHLMNITHVLRAEEWLPSTPKHIILYKAFEWDPPQFAHLSQVLATDRSKLSKRHGAVSIEEFRKSGYLPEAIINFIALIGWNPKTPQLARGERNREFFSIDELIKEFDIAKINKAGGVFDCVKLDHFNAHYIRNLSNNELITRIMQNSKINPSRQNSEVEAEIQNDQSKIKIDKIITVIKERMVKLSDFEELAKPFFKEIKYDPKLLIFKKSTKESTLKGLSLIANRLLVPNKVEGSQITKSKWQSTDKLNKILLEIVKEGNLTNGDVFWPVRVALSGLEKSPAPTELLWALGKEESLKRLRKGIKLLNNMRPSVVQSL